MNINNIVHKLIGWRGEDGSPINRRTPIRNLIKKSCTAKESAKLKYRFQLKKRKKKYMKACGIVMEP
jgi:hypothetical protein